MIGPQLPVAFCRCGTQLRFERVRWTDCSTSWECNCQGCIDQETFSDGSRSTHYVRGDGVSPWDALDDLAAIHFDCMPEELIKEEA